MVVAAEATDAFPQPKAQMSFNDGQMMLDPAPDLAQPTVSPETINKNLAADPYGGIALQSGVKPEFFFGAYTNLTRGEVDRESAAKVGLANAEIKLTFDHTPMLLAIFRKVPAESTALYSRGAGALDPEGQGQFQAHASDVVVLVDPSDGHVLSTYQLPPS